MTPDDRAERRLCLMETARELAAAAHEAGDDPAFRALARVRYFLALNVAEHIRTFPASDLALVPPSLRCLVSERPERLGRIRLVPSQSAVGPPWIVLPDLAHWCGCPAPGMCWHSAVSEVLDALDAQNTHE
jgi:hypothetical protein